MSEQTKSTEELLDKIRELEQKVGELLPIVKLQDRALDLMYENLKSNSKFKYHGLSYPKIFDCNLARMIWKKFFCPRGWHLFDECIGADRDPDSTEYEHSLYCDACGLQVIISEIVD